MTDPDELIRASRQLDTRLAQARAFRWAGVAAGAVVAILLIVLLLDVRGLGEDIETVAESTNEIVSKDVARLERTIEDQEEVLDQAVAAIIELSRLLQENGITPPEIVLQPTEEEPPDG